MLEQNRYQLNYLSKYFLFAKKAAADLRFKSCDEKDREELFQDFIDRLGEEDRNFRKQQSEQKVEILVEEMRLNALPSDTKWQSIIEPQDGRWT